MSEEKEVQKESSLSEAWGWVALTFIIVVFVGGLIVIGSTSQMKSELRKYKKAVRICGVENVQEHNFTNGNTGFNCRDYSILTKNK